MRRTQGSVTLWNFRSSVNAGRHLMVKCWLLSYSAWPATSLQLLSLSSERWLSDTELVYLLYAGQHSLFGCRHWEWQHRAAQMQRMRRPSAEDTR